MKKLLFTLLFLPFAGILHAQNTTEFEDGIYARFTTDRKSVV